MQPGSSHGGDPRLVSNRTMDIVVAVLFLCVSAIVIADSTRLGFRWIENEGPASGYFPFYIAVIMAVASIGNLVSAVLGRTAGGDDTFVGKAALGRVLAVLVPAIAYVAMVQFLGIYVASAIFICFFMLAIGRDSLVRSLAVSIAVPLVLFLMFEVWFLVPLPKGPFELWLGY
ncbi:MAG: tripartite tricarboxylate transporter TctB family protein [Sphingomonadales bacterium]|nr:tripartite tricarboxylate transporter TctB family protein [Sphingomonadales bacterium]